MSKFYIIGKISRDLAKRMQSDPNADRGAAIKAICDTVGVKFHSYEWVRGRFDVINIIEGDYESVLAITLIFLKLTPLTTLFLITSKQGIIRVLSI